ncbi:Major facilitator superfamily domain-containing protein 8 [Halocaridina rubra]|uniref:Major facilitator superfamily domain-containing protein 8 n=1 Tax=Halocaridina rubra TaxID=373956 RepID=A0AAN8WN23_HALRR
MSNRVSLVNPCIQFEASTIKIPCIVTVIFFILGNALYSILKVFDPLGDLGTYYGMIVSRFIVGLSSANVTLTRSYVAGATTLKERTTGIAIIAASQALGFVVGPVIQALVTGIIQTPLYSNADWLYLDKYTACGWIAAALGFINLVILMPFIFKEHNIAEKERALMKETDQNVKLPKPDYIGVGGTLFGFFVALFIFTLLETLAEPFVQDEYGWSDDKAVVIVGIALAVGGVLSVGMFAVSGILAKKYDERKVMLGLGFPLLIIGSFLALPWGNAEMPRKCDELSSNVTYTSTVPTSQYAPITHFPFEDYDVSDTTTNSHEDCYEDSGCPYDEQPWCEYTPQIPIPQLAISYIIIILGYPVCQSLCQAIYSKMLGPKPQGLWMGVLTGVGGLSRILGPIFVSYVYTYLGPYVTFGALTGSMVVAELELLVLFKRLIPMKIPSVKELKGFDGPASEKY